MVETPALANLQQTCRGLVAATDLPWDWEDRFAVMLAVVNAHRIDAVRAELSSAFQAQFSAAEDLPASAKQIADELGGLRGGQLLFTTAPDCSVVLYCAWWPWGGGETVSLRVGHWSALPNTLLETAFRDWFA
jgi:hypothetical protein